MAETYYDRLGVPRDASTADIEAAFRQRAKETHPDRSDAPDAAQRFQAVQRARQVLTDATERDRYDRLGHEAYVADRSVVGAAATTTGTGATAAAARGEGRTSETGDARADGFGDRGAAAWWAEQETRFDRQHAAENRSRSWYRPGADGDDGYRVTPTAARGVRFTAQRVGFAVVAFALYPLLVGGAFLPTFPVGVNVLLGLCALGLTVTLLAVPEAGVLVFGGWTLLAPLGLGLAEVALLSVLGTVVWSFCWIPLAIASANLLFQRA